MEIVRNRWNGYTYLFGDDERCVVSVARARGAEYDGWGTAIPR